MKRLFVSGILSLGLLAVSIFASACAGPQVRERVLAGDVQHERHATGIDSQSRDYND